MQNAWATDPTTVADELEASLEVGLTSVEAGRRLERWGANHLRRHRPRNAWLILFDQVKSLVVALLLAAAVAAAIFGEWLEAAAVTAVVVINTAIGFAMELSARRSMEALRSIGRTKAVVVRDGQPRTVSAEELVPGDLILLEAGDVVSADIRIIDASNLEANESVFTGESLPVSKSIDAVDADTVVADRTSMLFKGTSVSHGSARGLVAATGMQTELGKISSLVASVEETKTPLEVHLNALSKKLVWLCLGLAALVAVATFLQGRPLLIVVELSVALAVATIPEGLPVVATLALSRGMFRMARRNAVVKNLAAVETLGSTSVICTDKTGTLTENHLTVEQIESPVDPLRAVEIGALCNDASLADGGVGDALEVALLEAAERYELDRDELLKQQPRVRLEAFATSTMKMATVHETSGGDASFRFAVKGAPEAILDVSSRIAVPDGGPRPLSEADRETWLKLNDEMASEGLRIIAVAEKSANADDEPYEDLVFVGLVAFSDPIRADVKPSIEACRSAGIDVIMITGDQPSTAYRIGRDAGIEEGEVVHGRDIDAATSERLLRAHIFARVDPAQKLDLIELHQDTGAVVAMTGDGVNDAPALRKADIGIAMGRRGTDVAREAADMVLRDDSFPTIVAAVRQGRVIFDNVRLFVVYLLSCNVSELLVIAAATMIFPSTALPITPLQILYLNLVTDVFPALALGFGEGDEAVMRRQPRKLSEPVLTRFHWGKIAGYGALIATMTLATFAAALRVYDLGIDQAITIAFCTVAFAQLFHVFNMVSPGAPLFRNQIAANPYVWGAIALCTFLILGPFALDTTSEILSLTPLGATGWGLVAIGSTAPLIVGTIVRVLRRLVRSGSVSSG